MGGDRKRSPNGLTGVLLFSGLMLLGVGIGLAFGQPGIGAITGLGTWFTTMGLVRVWRDR